MKLKTANGRSGHTWAAYRRDLGALACWLEGNPNLYLVTPGNEAGNPLKAVRLIA